MSKATIRQQRLLNIDIQSGKSPYTQILPLTRDISIRYPNSKYFLKRLQQGIPFAFPRLTHGFWLAVHGEENDNMCMIGVHGMGIPEFIPEILNSLDYISELPNMYLGVGLLDYIPDPKVLVTGQADMYINTLSSAIKGKNLTLYDGRLFKEMAITGEIAVLPSICQQTHTLVVGSSVFSDLGERWNLPNYTHIEIPLILASKSRYEILANIEKHLSNSSKPPIVLFRAGSLSYWLIYNLSLKYPDVFYLDLGQVFNIWFLDQELDWWHWGNKYFATIIKSCNLEGYYRNRLGNNYESWYKSIEQQDYKTLKKKRHLLWLNVPVNTVNKV